MKKLVALLLVLMLPCGALAETFKLTIKTEMSEAFVDELSRMLAPKKEDTPFDSKADLILQIAQRIVNGFALEMTMQDNAAVVRVRMGGDELMDLSIHDQDGMSYMTTSLLPGYALVERASSSTSVTPDTDWAKLADSSQNAFRAWLSERAPVITYGAFSGAAYESGVRCFTWTFAQEEIAALLSNLLSGEVRVAVTPWLLSAGLNAGDTFSWIDNMLKSADDGEYSYILRLVDDAAEEPVGVSLTVLREEAQIASVSIGAGEVERIVIGLGMQKENYWWEFTMNRTSRGNTTEYSGISREWAAPKEQSFAVVQASNQPKTQYRWFFTSKQLDEANKLNVAILPMTEDAEQRALLAVEVDLEPAEAITPIPDGLTVCADTDTEKYDTLMNQFSAVLAARMIKLLPMDLIIRLNMMP